MVLNAGNPGASYQWSTGETTAGITPATPGAYWVTAAFGNCVAADTIQIILLPYPFVFLGRDSALCSGDMITLDASNAGSSFLWNDSDTAQTKIITDTGTYTVIVTNNDGCTAADTIEFSTLGCQVNLFIPNSFTPNADGINEYFHPYTYNVISLDMAIFNRWGQKIFSTNQFLPGWDGSFNQQACPDGVYAFVINYTGEDEQGNIIKKRKTGAVRLIR